jgi:hypothetical protein
MRPRTPPNREDQAVVTTPGEVLTPLDYYLAGFVPLGLPLEAVI